MVLTFQPSCSSNQTLLPQTTAPESDPDKAGKSPAQKELSAPHPLPPESTVSHSTNRRNKTTAPRQPARADAGSKAAQNAAEPCQVPPKSPARAEKFVKQSRVWMTVRRPQPRRPADAPAGVLARRATTSEKIAVRWRQRWK